jgi:hypothetical protein
LHLGGSQLFVVVGVFQGYLRFCQRGFSSSSFFSSASRDSLAILSPFFTVSPVFT